MGIYRDAALGMEIPTEGHSGSFARMVRAQKLDEFVNAAEAWLVMLGFCKATGEDLDALGSLKSDVTAFKEWAQAGRDNFEMLDSETLKDGTKH